MKLPKTLEYEVKLIWDKESGGDVCIRHFPKLKVDIPTEFGGKSKSPCPDELFFSAVGGCLLTTFLYFKEKMGLELRGLQVSVKGALSNIGRKGYQMTGIEVLMHMDVDQEERIKAEECVELAREYCHLTRSLERGIPVKVESEISCLDIL